MGKRKANLALHIVCLIVFGLMGVLTRFSPNWPKVYEFGHLFTLALIGAFVAVWGIVERYKLPKRPKMYGLVCVECEFADKCPNAGELECTKLREFLKQRAEPPQCEKCGKPLPAGSWLRLCAECQEKERDEERG